MRTRRKKEKSERGKEEEKRERGGMGLGRSRRKTTQKKHTTRKIGGSRKTYDLGRGGEKISGRVRIGRETERGQGRTAQLEKSKGRKTAGKLRSISVQNR